MPTASSNLTVTATTFAGAQLLFSTSSADLATPDTAVQVYTIHNRDATNYVRVVVAPIHKGGDGGAAIAPGATVPFRCGGITKVVVWTEGGTPSIDGFVEVN